MVSCQRHWYQATSLDKEAMKTYLANGGIGNRFNVLVNALVETHYSAEECLVHWPVNEHLRAPVEEVVDVRLLPPRMTVVNAHRRVVGAHREPYSYGLDDWADTVTHQGNYHTLYRHYGRRIVLVSDETPEIQPVLHIRALRQNIRIPWDAIHEELEGVENLRLCTDSRKALVLAMEKLPGRFARWSEVTGTHDLHNRGCIASIVSDFVACCWANKLFVVAPRESAFCDAATYAYGVPTVRIE